MNNLLQTSQRCQTIDNTSSQIMSSLNDNIDQLMNKIMQVQNQCIVEPKTTYQSQQNARIQKDNQKIQKYQTGLKMNTKFSKNKKKTMTDLATEQCKQNAYQHFYQKDEQTYKFKQKQKSFTTKKISDEIIQQRCQGLYKSEKISQNKNVFGPILPKTLSSLFDNNVIRQVKKSNIINDNLFNTFSQISLQSTVSSMSSSIIQKNPQINENTLSLKDFVLGGQLGSGKFGDVYRCWHKKTGSIYAIKKIFKSTIKEYNMQNQLALQIKILYKINHPNIIKLYAHFDDEYHIFLLMQYAYGQQLIKKLKSNQEFISKTIDQVIDSVEYIHNNGIIHRDIKPQNIIMAFQNTVKLCDFGWASIFNQNHMRTTFCGTLDYLSPEMKDIGRYTFTVDIWSIGILIYELFTGQAPFKDKLNGNNKKSSHQRRYNSFKWNIVYPHDLSGLAQTFMRNFLKQNPEDRASLKYCKNHIFLKKYRQYERNNQLYSILL